MYGNFFCKLLHADAAASFANLSSAAFANGSAALRLCRFSERYEQTAIVATVSFGGDRHSTSFAPAIIARLSGFY